MLRPPLRGQESLDTGLLLSVCSGDAETEHRLVDTAGRERVGQTERAACKHTATCNRDSGWELAG